MNDKKELISVIIPVYRVEKYLERCIDSVINQTYDYIEIILIDDGSDDMCPKICDNYAQKDIRIKVIHQNNRGLQWAREKGIEASKGKFIFFVDSDDYIEKDAVEFLYNMIKQYNADISIAGHYIAYSEDNKKLFYKSNNVKPLILEGDDKLITLFEAKKFQSHLWNKLIKKELIKNIKSNYKSVYEDIAISYKIFDKANKIVFSNVPKYNYIKNLNSILNSNFSEKKMCITNICDDIVDYVRNTQSSKVLKSAVALKDRMYICTANDIASKYESNHKDSYKIIYKYIQKNIKNILYFDKLDIKFKIAALVISINPQIYIKIVQKIKKMERKNKNAKN